MLYVVCGREYHSLEIAFSDRDDAVNWIGDQVGRYDIVPVQLCTDIGEGLL
jgi:hypothetical protein